MGPLHGMYGSVEAELEVERTIKRAELTAFLCLLRKVSGPIKDHVDNKGIIDGLRKGEKVCIMSSAGHADLWIKNWEELHELEKRGIPVEVEHVKAHRTKKEKEKMKKLKGSSPKAMRRVMTWQKQEQCWTKELWQKREQKF